MEEEEDDDGRPIPFIVMKGREDSVCKIEFEVTDEAREFLSLIDSPISVLSVVGMYRTGKSFLLNRILLGRKDGFPVGSTVNACTKGLWIWSKPLRGKTADGSEVNVILIDTEGLGSLNANTQHDCYIFALALLTSSIFLYNSVGTINESALENLSLVVNLTKFIRVGSRVQREEEDGTEFARYFPKLLWIVRDFTLQLVDQNGRPITSKQYLENALREVKGFSDKVVEKNRIRNMIKAFFPDRDCYPIVRPVEDERMLQSLSSQGEEVLRESFVKQMKILRERVFSNAELKTVQGGQVSGRMLILLSESYVKAVNDGSVPSITDSWSMVCDSECKKILKECMDMFDRVTTSLIESKEIPMDEERLKEWHSVQRRQLSDLLLSKTESFKGEFQEKYLQALDDSLSDKLKELLKKNAELGQLAIHAMIESIFSEIETSLNSGKYKSWRAFEKDRSEAKERFLKDSPAIRKRDEIFLQYLERLFCKAGSLIFEQMVAEMEMMERECKRECSEVKYKAKEEIMAIQQEMEEAKLKLMHESRRGEDERDETKRLKEKLETEEEKWRVSEERREEGEKKLRAALQDLEVAEENFQGERVIFKKQLEQKESEIKRLMTMLEDLQCNEGNKLVEAQTRVAELNDERRVMSKKINDFIMRQESLTAPLAAVCQEVKSMVDDMSEVYQHLVELEVEDRENLILLDLESVVSDLRKIEERDEKEEGGGKVEASGQQEEEENKQKEEDSVSSSHIANLSDSSARAVLQGINFFIQEDQDAYDAAKKEEAATAAAETSSVRAASPSPSLLEHMFHDSMLLGGAEHRLPEDWITVISRTQGRPYFFNKRTKQSTWTLPGSERDFPCYSGGNSAASSPTSSPRRGSSRLGFSNGLHPPPLSQKLHSDYPTPPPPRPDPAPGGLSGLETRLSALEQSVNRALEVPPDERTSGSAPPLRDASSFETPRMVKACRVPSSRCARRSRERVGGGGGGGEEEEEERRKGGGGGMYDGMGRDGVGQRVRMGCTDCRQVRDDRAPVAWRNVASEPPLLRLRSAPSQTLQALPPCFPAQGLSAALSSMPFPPSLPPLRPRLRLLAPSPSPLRSVSACTPRLSSSSCLQELQVSAELFSSQASRWFNRFDPDLIECRRVILVPYSFLSCLPPSPLLLFRPLVFPSPLMLPVSSDASRAGEVTRGEMKLEEKRRGGGREWRNEEEGEREERRGRGSGEERGRGHRIISDGRRKRWLRGERGGGVDDGGRKRLRSRGVRRRC
eukprot:766095-Hanusia_phi.AAC.1